jgi:hypothetical protein
MSRPIFAGPGGECRLARRLSDPRKAGGWAARVKAVWHPPDPYEPTSQLYRLMPSRRPADDDPLIDLTLPRQSWWRQLAARARPVSRQAIRWTWGITAGVVTGVLVTLISTYLLNH